VTVSDSVVGPFIPESAMENRMNGNHDGLEMLTSGSNVKHRAWQPGRGDLHTSGTQMDSTVV
jgi:hypothetical protein